MRHECTQEQPESAQYVPLQSIYEAREAIRGIALRTPLVEARALGRASGAEVWLKLETAQPTGAFKIRGAANALQQLSAEDRQRGVVCASTGNHGRAVAFAARRLGIAATVCLSRLVPANKVDAIRALGAEARITGDSQDDAQAEADRLAGEGRAQVPPFDHPDIIAGQGTIGLELLEDLPKLDTVVVPLSGGGLIAGIAQVVKAASPTIRVIGVTIARGGAMQASLLAGQPVDVEEEPTLADSLGGGIGLDNRLTFAMVRDLVDKVVPLGEEQIVGAMRALFVEEGWVAEGAGAVGAALLIEPGLARLGCRIAVVVSGRNVAMDLFRRVVDGVHESTE